VQTESLNEWWIDERAHAGAEHLDERYVLGYDRKAGYDAPRRPGRPLCVNLG